MATPVGSYDPSKELTSANTIVTSSKPGYPGIQVYLGPGTEISGAIPVVVVSGAGGSTVNISSSQSEPVWVTGTVVATGVEITFSGSISPTPPEAYPNTIENLRYSRKLQVYDLTSDSANYIGYSVLGTAQTSTSWTIKKLSFDVLGNLEQISWSSTTASWSNRTSEVYS